MSSDFDNSNLSNANLSNGEISNSEPGDAAPHIGPTEIVNPEMVEGSSADPQVGILAEDKLSFLHPSSLVFELLAHVKSYLVPAAIGLFGAAKGDFFFIILSAVIFVPAFLTCVFRYFTLRYCIKDDHLIVKQGLIFRNVRTVPVARIQNIDFVQNPLHRILKVAEVKVETASGTKPEATLRVLSMAQMELLRKSVFEKQKTSVDADHAMPDSLTSNVEYPQPLIPGMVNQFSTDTNNDKIDSETLLEIPLSWLFRAGIASNRGLLIIGVAFGLYLQFGGDRQSYFEFGWLRNLIPVGTSTLWTVVTIVSASIGALIILRLMGIGWYILRFYGYKLVRRGEDLRISCGLFTKVSATIPRERIQFISIHRNLIMRWLGLSSIRIETAGGAGNSNESATESVSKRWFIPVIPDDQVSGILAILRPKLEWNESQLVFRPLAQKAGRRLCRLAIIESVLLAGVGLLFWRPWGWVAGLIALPFLLAWAIKKSKSMRYARNENIVVYRSGVLNRKTSMTFFEKIQVLSVDQSPFDRRWKMAKLSVDTAAAGQAEHQIHVPYLDEQFAFEELQLLRAKTGQEQPVFG